MTSWASVVNRIGSPTGRYITGGLAMVPLMVRSSGGWSAGSGTRSPW